MAVIRVERSVRAPAEAVWEAIADVESIGEFAPIVSRAEAEGEGVGMTRRCWDGNGNHWDEVCVAWEPGERYTFEVDTTTSGSRMHRLFDAFAGTFGVEADGEGSRIWVAFEVGARFGPVGSLLLAAMRPMVRAGAGAMLDSYVEAVEGRPAAEAARAVGRKKSLK